MSNTPKALDKIADIVLAYKPKPKSDAAKKRTRRAKKRTRRAKKIAKETKGNG